ncbi:MAG: phosphate ABC transporter permease PstA [Caldilineaceae bacterium]|nr:phosphate ABC transporter permease PstA [Caldilineaceae bacterium]
MAVNNQWVRGAYPAGREFDSHLRRRKQVGAFWHGAFFVATLVGIVVLAALLIDVINDAFGYVAIQNRIDPETLVRQYYKEKMLDMPRTLGTEDDEVIVNGVAARPQAIGFFGYSYYQNNADKLKLLSIDGAEPTAATIESGEYSLSRPLYIYSTREILREKPQVAAFLYHYLTTANAVVEGVGYFPLSQASIDEALATWEQATGLGESAGGNQPLASGDIEVTGSSTVAPLTERLASDMIALGLLEGTVNVESVGTDAGFRTFCVDGQGDLVDASRPINRLDISACQEIGRNPLEFHVANDGVPLVVSSENEFVDALTTEEVRQIFTEAELWSDVNPEWPEKPIFRLIPGADSGTLDFFVEQVFGTTLEEQSDETLTELLQTHVSAGRLRALESELPLAERTHEQLLTLLNDEVVKPQIVESWNLFDSLFNRQDIEAETAQIPNADLEFHNWASWNFIASPQSSDPTKAGIRTAILGSLWATLLAFLLAVPLGVAAAIYLEEYSTGQNRFDQVVETNINNLAGVPSIIYGMLGLAVFVRFLGPITSGIAFGYSDPATANGRTVLSAGLTLGVLILPLVIINAREAIRAVPRALREASFGLGATKWQTIWHHVLPNAISGILTGVILSVSRAFGETAPLVVVGVSTFIVVDPNHPFSKFTALPVQVYQWTSRPQAEFQHLAAAAIIVLLILLLMLNAAAIWLRNRYSRRLQ